MKKSLITALLLTSAGAHAECVLGQSTATGFRVLDPHTFVLMGGVAGYTMIRTFAFLQPSSNVAVAKDSFCDFESGTLVVDGQRIDIQEVKHLN